MVEREGEHFVARRAGRGHPMQPRQDRILIRTRNALGVRQEIIEFRARGHRRRAAVARHDQRPAGVGVARAMVVVLAAHPAGLEAGRKGVARAQHVQHLDLDPAAVERVVERGGNRTVDDGATQRTALDHQRGRRNAAYRAQRFHDVGAAARDVEFLDGADDEVELGQDRLQVRGDVVGAHVARLAVAALGEPPQHRAIVDVEDRAYVVRARPVQREIADAVDVVGREMRAGDEQRPRLRDERLLDIVLGDRHVGAVLAQEDERKRILVLDPQHHRAGQARGIDAHVTDVAAFTGDRLHEETAEGVVADARDEPRPQTEARAAERRIGRRAAQVLRKTGDILQPRADLLGVEIDREAAQAQDVEAATGGEGRGVLHVQSEVRPTRNGA